jgi:virginiamycin B lyase
VARVILGVNPGGYGLTEYTVGGQGAQPEAIAFGADHNLWVGEFVGNHIDRLNIMGSQFRPIGLPAGAQPTGVTRGPDGNIWFTEQSNSIARYEMNG